MIRVVNVNKYFGDLHVLKGVSLEVKEGEIISIVGESGAGKSTLLHIIGTLDQSTNPEKYNTEIEIDNIVITKLKDRQISKFRNKNLGFIFQFHQLLPEFTAVENVIMPGLIAGEKKNEIVRRAKDILGLLKLSHRLDHKPSQLSGGEQQRVAVARALINSPKLILADEPSGNLDSKNAEDLHQLFYDLRVELNQTFIIVTHNQNLADMSDRKFVMKDGNIINNTSF